MKKLTAIVISASLTLLSSTSFAATLTSMTQAQVNQTFANKTMSSISTAGLDNKIIQDSITIYMDGSGHAFGKMLSQPANEPQMDKGVYSVAADGTYYLTWQHWNRGKKQCVNFFNTQNAYVVVRCDNAFQSVFLKNSVKNGNRVQ